MRQAVASLLLLPVIAVALPIARKLQDDDPPTCPPPNFDSVAGFNLARYISAPWCAPRARSTRARRAPCSSRALPLCAASRRFSIQQVPLIYQPSDELFCVRATYVPINPSDLSEGIHVFNEARAGSTSGERIGVSPSSSMPSQLLAFPDDLPEAQANASTAQSKLRVGVRELGFLYRTPVEPSEVSLPVIPGLPEIADIIPSFLQPLIPPEVNNFLANILEVVPTIISLIPSLIIGAVSRGGGQQPMMTPGNATSSLDTLFGVLVGLIPDEVIDFLQRAFFGPVRERPGVLRSTRARAHGRAPLPPSPTRPSHSRVRAPPRATGAVLGGRDQRRLSVGHHFGRSAQRRERRAVHHGHARHQQRGLLAVPSQPHPSRRGRAADAQPGHGARLRRERSAARRAGWVRVYAEHASVSVASRAHARA